MTDWIPLEERAPTIDDADVGHCVIWWHVYNGVMVTGWHQYKQNRFLTHWMPCPAPPENHKALRASKPY